MTTKNDDFLRALGLAKKAGKLICGTEQCREAIRKHKSNFLIIAYNISDNTKKSLYNTAIFYKCEIVSPEFLSMELLSKSIGLMKLCAAVCVTDKNFVVLIRKSIQ